MRCRHCGAQVPDYQSFCPSCGWPVRSSGGSRPGKETTAVILGVLAAIALIVGAFSVGRLMASDKQPAAEAPAEDHGAVVLPASSGQSQNQAPPVLPTPPAQLVASPFSGLLSDYTQRYFSAAYATSEFLEGKIRFSASYAIDESSNRPWVEGAVGSGIGEALTLWFAQDTTVQVLDLTLGYARSQQLYDKNNRPSRLRFSFSDGSSVDYGFTDQVMNQRVLLNRPVTRNYVQITILDVYRGTDDDTCIYLVKAYG